MTDPEPTLLLTRPEPQSHAFLEQCEAMAGRKLPAVISPILKIRPADPVPNLDAYATIVFTSANGVRCMADRGLLAGRTVRTVGTRTAELARAAGADALALGENVDEFVQAAGQIKGPALFCRGGHSRGDLAKRLRERGIRTDEAVIYDQEAQELSADARKLLEGSNPVLAPVFSPRSAEILGAHAGMIAPLVVLAMSRNVADAWAGPGHVLVAESPTARSMCALVVSQF